MGGVERAPVPDRGGQLRRLDDVRVGDTGLLGVRFEFPGGVGLGVRGDDGDISGEKRGETKRAGENGAFELRFDECDWVRVGRRHARRGRGEAAVRVWDFLQRRVGGVLRVAAVGDETDNKEQRRVEFVLADERGDYREWVFLGRVRVRFERLVFSQSELFRRRVGSRAVVVFGNV